MADIETKKIIEVEAKYETLADLAGAVTSARSAMSELTKGTAEYEKGMVQLKTAQDEYNKNVRLAVKENAAAKGSYNDLVNQLNRLKQAWNTTGDAMERAALTKQINSVKEELADLDHSIGNWQRNVGNYMNAASSSLGTFKDALEKGAHSSENLKGGVENLALGFKTLSTNPVMGFLIMLAPLINQITAGLKENGTALEAVQKLAKAFEPVGKTLTVVVEKLAGWFSKAVDLTVEFMQRNADTFGNLIAGAAGAGNAILNYLLTPIRTVITAAKGLGNIFKDIFSGNFGAIKADAQAAAGQVADVVAKGFSFKANYEVGKAAGLRFIEGIASREVKQKAGEAGTTAAEAFVDSFLDADKMLTILEKRQAAAEKFWAEFDKFFAGIEAEQMAEDDAYVDNLLTSWIDAGIEARKQEEQVIEDRKRNLRGLASATTSILDDVAGAYQNQLKAEVDAGRISAAEGEKRFKSVKAMQYAVTAINTATAIVSALGEPGLPWYVKAANAVAAGVTGAANMIKIANTSLGNTQASSATGQGVQQIQSVAPATQEVIQTTRIVTNADDMAQLNGSLKNIHAYVVTSELEGELKNVQDTRDETSF